MERETHSLFMGYVLWIFGILGAHRFYNGKPVSGTIYFITLGLLFIGWFIDLFLMPKLEADASRSFTAGDTNYSVGWILLTFLGIFGIHRFYLGKWGTGLIYLFTGGLLLIGIIYDFWTLNDQISQKNQAEGAF